MEEEGIPWLGSGGQHLHVLQHVLAGGQLAGILGIISQDRDVLREEA